MVEAEALFTTLDTNKDELLSRAEFDAAYLYGLSVGSLADVTFYWLKIDNNLNGYIGPEKLIDNGVIDPKLNLKVQSGELTEEELLKDIMRAFGDANGNGRVDQDEFNRFYEVLGTYVETNDPLLDLVKFTYKMEDN